MNNLDKHSVHAAVMRRSLAEVKRALSEGRGVDSLDREGRTPLFYAAMEGDVEIVSELILHHASVNLQDVDLKTPLHFASRSYHPKVVQTLLENGAAVDAQDIHGNTPLSDAIFDSRGRGEVIKILLAFGANKKLKNKHTISPEDLANSIANYEVAAFLK